MLPSVRDIAASAVTAQAPNEASIHQQLVTYLRVTAGRSANEYAQLVRLTTCPAVLSCLLTHLDLLDRLPLSHACHALLNAVPPGPHIICSMFEMTGGLPPILLPSDGSQQLRVPIWCPGLWDSLSALLARVPDHGVALRIESDLSDALLDVLSAHLHKLSSLELNVYQVRIHPHLTPRRGRGRAIAHTSERAARHGSLETQKPRTWAGDALFQRLLHLLRQPAPRMHTLRVEVQPAEDLQDVFLPSNLLSGAANLLRLHLFGVDIPFDCPGLSFAQLVAFDYAPTGGAFDLGSIHEILKLMPSLVTLGLTLSEPHAPAALPHTNSRHAHLRHVSLNLHGIEYSRKVQQSIAVLCDFIAFFRKSCAPTPEFAAAIPSRNGLVLPSESRFNYARVEQGHLWAHLWMSAGTDDHPRPPELSMLSHRLWRASYILAHVVELTVSTSNLIFGDGHGPDPPPRAPALQRLTVRVDMCGDCDEVYFWPGMDSVWVWAYGRYEGSDVGPWECPALRDVVLTLPAKSAVTRPGMCADGCLLAIAGLDTFVRSYLVLSPAAKPLRSLTVPSQRVLDHEMPIARGLADEVILTDGADIYYQDIVQRRPVYPLPHWGDEDARWHAAPSSFFDTLQPSPICLDGWVSKRAWNDGNTMGPDTRDLLYQIRDDSGHANRNAPPHPVHADVAKLQKATSMLRSVRDIAASAVAEPQNEAGIRQQLVTYLRVTAGHFANASSPLVRLATCPAALSSLLANLDLLDRLPLSHSCHALLKAVSPGPRIVCSMFDAEGFLQLIQVPSDGAQQLRGPIWCPGLWDSLSALLSRVPEQGIALRIEGDLSDALLEVLGAHLHKLSSLELKLYQVHLRPHLIRRRGRGRAHAVARIFERAVKHYMPETPRPRTWAGDALFQRLLQLLRKRAPGLHTLRLKVLTPEDRQVVCIPSNLLSGAANLRRLHLFGVCIPSDCLRPAFAQLVVFDYAPNCDPFDLGSMQEILDLMPTLVTLGLTLSEPHVPAFVPHTQPRHACLRHVALNLYLFEHTQHAQESVTVLCDLIDFFQQSVQVSSSLEFAAAIPSYYALVLPEDPRFNYPRVDQARFWSHLWTSTDDRSRPPVLSMLSHGHRLWRARFMFANIVELAVDASDLVTGQGPGTPPRATALQRLTIRVDMCKNCNHVSFPADTDSVWMWMCTNWWRDSGVGLRQWACPALRDVVLTFPARSAMMHPVACEEGCLLAIAGFYTFVRSCLALAPAAKPLRSLTLPANRVLDHEMPIAHGLADEVILTDRAKVCTVHGSPVYPVYHQEDEDSRWCAAPSSFFDTQKPRFCLDGWADKREWNDGNTMGPNTRHLLY
ncbi:hypothetical protein AURDEDRAFT_126752 [Auricularia subglabra TFB-10046 SS5]|nr:hypothetical protein AURDEDRAFT_126752 [Auricularia subglabra TFB-10046 SS5]